MGLLKKIIEINIGRYFLLMKAKIHYKSIKNYGAKSEILLNQ